MAFDPDKYLAKQEPKSGGFDPDAYLGRTSVEPDRSLEVPTPENLARERARPVQPSEPKGFGERAQEVAGNIFPMARSFSRKGTAELLGPSITALTASGGALLGTPGGPAGMVGGGALGYGIGEELVRRIRGDQPTPLSQTAKDILTGATFEAGGRAAMPYIEKAAKATAAGAGKIRDVFDISRQRAARIARESIGPENIEAARAALRAAASEDVTAAQALAQIDAGGRPVLNLPVAQALLRRAAERDPNFFTSLFNEQEIARLSSLESIAGAANQTAARQAREEMQKILNEKLIPVLTTEMEAANIAGRMAPRFRSEAERFEAGATEKVQDVRRMTAAADRARATQEFPVPGMPRVSTRITYRGDLADAADKVADQAAAGSLIFGEAGRFNRAALQSLEAHNLRPLTGNSINSAIQSRLADPKLAPGNRDLQNALTRIAEDIQQWTNSNGVIDAWALDTIRKNSINAYINSLPLQPKQARQLAANLTEQIKPVLIDAVEQAGGTGYRQYLRDYAQGMQIIGQSKLGAEAMKLYADNPAAFVRLVEGNDPKKVQQIFGTGSYDIMKEMSNNAMSRLTNVANQVKRDIAIDKQVSAGEKALVELMRDNMKLLRLPNLLNVYATGYNNAIGALEEKVGRRTLQILTESAKTARSFDELLSTIPAVERSAVLRALQDPSTFEPSRRVVGGIIGGLSQSNQPRPETLNTQRMGGITNVTPSLGGR